MKNLPGRLCVCASLVMGLFFCCSKTASAQRLRPGLPGMSPSKWITIRNTQAPSRIYQYQGSPAKTYKQEDLFFKAWIPIVNGKRTTILLGPQYRSEQLEFRGEGENPLHLLSNWNLRSMGVDLRSCFRIDSASWLVMNFNVNQSGNLRNRPNSDAPLNYTLSTVFIRQRNSNTEIGYGLMLNRSMNRFNVLPVFMLNYNYSSKGGFEISLPYKIAWRNNLSPTDILYVKTEAMSRAYWINGTNQSYAFRRTELDMGIAYNKQFNRFFGAEVFGGYRRNINTRLPHEVTAIRPSGLFFTMEIYFRSPFK